MDHNQSSSIGAGARQPFAKSARRSSRGMTLLEAMFAMALVSGIIVLVFGALGNQGRVATEQFVEVDLQTQLRRGTDELVNQFTDAHLIALSEYARWVDYNFPKVPRDAAGLPIPGAADLKLDNTKSYGIFDERTSPPTWIENGFYHLEAVDDVAGNITVNEAQWHMNVDGDLNGNETGVITFTPCRFELTAYYRMPDDVLTAPANLKLFNTGNAANESARIAKGNPRLKGSAILDSFKDPADVTGPSDTTHRLYSRTLTLRCYRDSTARCPAPWNEGEGCFYMRRLASPSPIQQANSYTDSNGNGEYDAGEPVSVNVYPSDTPLVYKGQYFPEDTDNFDEVTQNSPCINYVLDDLENWTAKVPGKYNHNIRIVLYAVHDGSTSGMGRGQLQGVKRVQCAHTLIKLRNGNRF